MTIHDKSFLTFIRATRKRLRKDYDLVVALTGYEGEGKSTLNIHFGRGVDGNFDLDKNIAYMPTYNYMKDKFFALPAFGYLGADEAIKVLHKHQWMKRLQQAIVQLYATGRSENKCTGLCIPRFWDLNENFRNHRVKVWIHILKRGYAVAYLKDDNEFAKDPWHMNENYFITEKIYGKKGIAERTIEDRLKAARRTTNYWFDFEFPDLDNGIKKEYLRLREHYRKQYKEEEESETSVRIEQQSLWIANAIESMNKEHGVPILKISQRLGMSEPTAHNYLKILKLKT